MLHCPLVVARLKEKGGEKVIHPEGEMRGRGVVEPGGLVLVGEEGVHCERERERERAEGGGGRDADGVI